MKHANRINRLTALALVLSLLLTACGASDTPAAGTVVNRAEAASMRLRRTEGSVGVSDSEGQDVEPAENLGLYSGYGIGTDVESYAWIDLDTVKLTKLDQESEAAVQKEGKRLEIEVKSGSLFFNVTEPLEEDETLEIRTSSMIVGIRGTCGWVEVPDGEHMNVYLLEGAVACSTGAEEVSLLPTGVARMTDGGGIEVSSFGPAEIPAFVLEELIEDEPLLARVEEASGYDLSGGAGDTEGQDGESGGGENNAPEGEPFQDYEYNAQGQVSRINYYDGSGALEYYEEISYTVVSGETWVDVETYNSDGSLDGWSGFDSLEEFYSAYADVLP